MLKKSRRKFQGKSSLMITEHFKSILSLKLLYQQATVLIRISSEILKATHKRPLRMRRNLTLSLSQKAIKNENSLHWNLDTLTLNQFIHIYLRCPDLGVAQRKRENHWALGCGEPERLSDTEEHTRSVAQFASQCSVVIGFPTHI